MFTDISSPDSNHEHPSSVHTEHNETPSATQSTHNERMDAAERCLSRRQLRHWKIGTIAALGAFILYLFLTLGDNTFGSTPVGGDYIARIKAEGVITADDERNKRLQALAENDNVKAVILHVDSPGGTLIGGEDWYNALLVISEKKPVVTIVNGMAASGGYMAALGTDRIFVREGSIVGSVGVIYQSANIQKLAEKMGVTVLSYSSGILKAQPSPVTDIAPGAEEMIISMITDVQQMFLNMAKTRRNLKDDVVTLISDGRIVSGKNAVDINLADAVGSEKDALVWLEEARQVDISLDIRDEKLYKRKSLLERKFGALMPDWLGGAAARASMPAGLLAMHPF